MKKTIVSIWMICYLALTVGVSVNFHYCMNKLDSTRLFASASKSCDKCGMHTDKSNGCCRDEVKMVKAGEDQKIVSSVSFELPAVEAIVQIPSLFIATSFYNAASEGSYRHIPPPLLSGQDIYLQNGVFRI